MRIRSAYGFGFTAAEAPRPLREQLKTLCPQAPRRLNRFTELALIGALGCAAEAAIELAPDCALYLGTGHGCADDSTRLLEAMLMRGQAPMPVDFINVSGSSTGFYLAQVLGLRGPSKTVAAGPVSFEAALDLAWGDLTDAPGLALVGGVDDAAYPLAVHRKRLGLAEVEPVAEVSGWLLLDSRPGAKGLRLCEPRFFCELCELEAVLVNRHEVNVSLAQGLDQVERERLAAKLGPRVVEPALSGRADTAAAFEIAVLAGQGGSLLHANGDGKGGYYLLEIAASL